MKLDWNGVLTIVLGGTIGALVGALGGAYAGYRLSRKEWREQWELDNKLKEYRDVLDVLSRAYLALEEEHKEQLRIPASESLPILSEKAQIAKNESFRILDDRIFTAAELKSAQIRDSWGKAIDVLNQDPGTYGFRLSYGQIRGKVLALGTRPCKQV